LRAVGLNPIREFVAEARGGTRLAWEHAPGQGGAVRALLREPETPRHEPRPRFTRGTFAVYNTVNVRRMERAAMTEEVEAFERCIAVGGVALFPADTVYGLATDPESREGVERLYRLKGRPPDRPAAVMFFQKQLALEALPELPERTREAMDRLLPGQVTLLLPNPGRRFPLAGGPNPDVLGVRVPAVRGPLADMPRPVLQSSANRSGGADARRVDEVDEGIRAGVDLVLDGGELPGTPSTVVDLTTYHEDGRFEIRRAGAVSAEDIRNALVRSTR
jgi:L-threonylcarbamoyladenylate synthase